MIAARNFYVFNEGKPPIRNYLLRKDISTLLAHAESHDHEYGEAHIDRYVDEKITSLQNRREAFEQDNPNGVFNISEDEAKLYFYVIRSLIRRSAPGGRLSHRREEFLNQMRELLQVPSIRASLHLEVNGGRTNDLLRLALELEHVSAAHILLGAPAVRSLARQNNFYRDELQGNLNLAELAHDKESSMVALSPTEKRLFSKLEEKYKPKGKAGEVMAKLREDLQARYKKNPASIALKMKDGKEKKIDLPLNWQDFQKLCKDENLKPAQIEQAKVAYYKNNAHTAFRYLSRPNYWMDKKASYVNVDEHDKSLRYSTFADYTAMIDVLYLAASDEEVGDYKGYTNQSRKDLFIKALALIGRAHNWDKTRIKCDAKGRPIKDKAGHAVEEEYDDLEGDKPSCYSGVKRRLFQSVLGHPLLEVLSKEMLRDEVRVFASRHFKEKISRSDPRELRAAVDKNILELEPEDACLVELNIDSQAQKAFMTYLSKKYGGQFSRDPMFMAYVHDLLSLKNFKSHLVKFYMSFDLGGLLNDAQRMARPEKKSARKESKS